MNFHRLGACLNRLIFLNLVTLLFASCSSARKDRQAGTLRFGGPGGEPILTEDRVDRLRAIANDPNSHLDSEAGASEVPMDLALRAPFENQSDESAQDNNPSADVSSWSASGFDPDSIWVGDIISDHAGPYLKKVASIGDRVSSEEWAELSAELVQSQSRRVPMTLSLAELNALQSNGHLSNDLPKRSVALDFRTQSEDMSRKDLESFLESASEEIADLEARSKVIKDFATVRSRLQAGESLHIITGVTFSLEMKASYPGAPIGQRDVELIRNAVLAVYPHLEGLAAEKVESHVRIERSPRIYWAFEVRQISLKGDRIRIEEGSLAQL